MTQEQNLKQTGQGCLYRIGEISKSPWGSWQVLDIGRNYIVKKLLVLPQKRLSLQYHYHRDETWIVVSGIAFVEIDNTKQYLKPSENISILKLQKHRLSNQDDKNNLVIIEVSFGKLLAETDIVRIEDDFKRV